MRGVFFGMTVRLAVRAHRLLKPAEHSQASVLHLRLQLRQGHPQGCPREPRGPYDRTGGFGSPNDDVDLDGERFLMTKTERPADETTQFNLVLNWFEELKQRLGN